MNKKLLILALVLAGASQTAFGLMELQIMAHQVRVMRYERLLKEEKRRMAIAKSIGYALPNFDSAKPQPQQTTFDVQPSQSMSFGIKKPQPKQQ